MMPVFKAPTTTFRLWFLNPPVGSTVKGPNPLVRCSVLRQGPRERTFRCMPGVVGPKLPVPSNPRSPRQLSIVLLVFLVCPLPGILFVCLLCVLVIQFTNKMKLAPFLLWPLLSLVFRALLVLFLPRPLLPPVLRLPLVLFLRWHPLRPALSLAASRR